MITADRMAEVDRNAAALGVPRSKLMESSGNALARVVRERTDPGARVTMVCGRGNNGGDAFVAARFLANRDVTVLLAGRPETIRTRIAHDNWTALERAELPHETLRDTAAIPADDPRLADADLLVDALLGTGVRGALREPERTLVERLNATSVSVVSVDVPSGMDADTGEPTGDRAVAADGVVTFHDAKPGLVERADRGAFELTVADIGVPPAAERFVGPGDLRPLARRGDAHKGDHGEVLVVGGGPYTGAPTLSARAAARAGGDLVRVAVPESIAREVQGFDAGLIVRPLAGDHLSPANLDRVRQLASENDTVVLGPGLGDAVDTHETVETFLRSFDGTCVVDADALDALPAETDATVIATPHAGEFARVSGETPGADRAARVEAVERFVGDTAFDCTVVLKGPHDVISDGETTRINRTGTPAMTVGGTGDVLAGVTGALAARLPPVRAASVAAYATGLAGSRVAEGDNGLTASDLLPALPAALTDDGGDDA